MNLLISLLWILDWADEAIDWNPYNKVVQSHRDGTIYLFATNYARKQRGLRTPWTPAIGYTEVKLGPVF